MACDKLRLRFCLELGACGNGSMAGEDGGGVSSHAHRHSGRKPSLLHPPGLASLQACTAAEAAAVSVVGRPAAATCAHFFHRRALGKPAAAPEGFACLWDSTGVTVTAKPTWPNYRGRRKTLPPGATYEEGISVLIDSRRLRRVLNLRANQKHSGGALQWLIPEGAERCGLGPGLCATGHDRFSVGVGRRQL